MLVYMKILYAISVPHLSYGCDVIEFSAKEMNRLHVALNDAIRKIFTFARWESVKILRESFGYLSITEIFAKRKTKFMQRIPSIGNPILTNLISVEQLADCLIGFFSFFSLGLPQCQFIDANKRSYYWCLLSYNILSNGSPP